MTKKTNIFDTMATSGSWKNPHDTITVNAVDWGDPAWIEQFSTISTAPSSNFTGEVVIVNGKKDKQVSLNYATAKKLLVLMEVIDEMDEFKHIRDAINFKLAQEALEE